MRLFILSIISAFIGLLIGGFILPPIIPGLSQAYYIVYICAFSGFFIPSFYVLEKLYKSHKKGNDNL
ncbi:hypothetical protein K154306013_09200 [Clostridium tetani]|uniref:hypothetical protein n=1 Tax=Clostridium tetani TaxID=1513 RepID=UPI0010265692|nr:hypothetical protein [Clostridium tetani]RXI72121.1 hypothetical protein DP127_07620 [Clostridium tetani]BDR75260.1 hypothetical protein K154306013_09200 [Clostridium tetani]